MTWRQAIAKSALLATVKDAKESCGIDQLCAGLESGIEGGIHAMQHVWDAHRQEEEWGFLLIDARNAFNEQNQMAMLWTVRHEWPSGARFVFNCYRHWGTLMIRGNNGTGVFLYSKEGVTQGDPISMFIYGIGLLPLIRQLKAEFPTVQQPWYADDAGAGGKFDAIRHHFERLQEIGPNFGYYPESSKSILIVPQHNYESALEYFQDLSFTVTTGSRYLGGFIGEDAPLREWLRSKTEDWEAAISELASVCQKYPQSAYSGLQKLLQQEWQFVQRVVKNVGHEFEGVERALAQVSLPALFDDNYDDAMDPRRCLAALPVKFAGLAIPNPTASAATNYDASILVCSHLLAPFRGVDEFRTADHLAVIREVKTEL